MESERYKWLGRARGTSMQMLSFRGSITLMMLVLFPRVGATGTDWKTYAGSMCQAGHRTTLVDYDAFGGICNTSQEQNVVIHCPVVRDYSQSVFPPLIRHAGRSGRQDVSLVCRLRSMKREAENSGVSMQDVVIDLVPITSDGSSTISFVETSLFNFPILKTDDWGALVLTCDLPPSDPRSGPPVRSCLYNYSIKEWDGRCSAGDDDCPF